MGVALSGGRDDDLPQKNFFYLTRTYAFRGEGVWHSPDHATPSNFLFPKSWDPELSADVSFVSVLAMVLSEYLKRLEEKFQKRLFPQFCQNDKNYKNIFSATIFNILKERLLVQKQILYQQKALDLSFNLTP